MRDTNREKASVQDLAQEELRAFMLRMREELVRLVPRVAVLPGRDTRQAMDEGRDVASVAVAVVEPHREIAEAGSAPDRGPAFAVFLAPF